MKKQTHYAITSRFYVSLVVAISIISFAWTLAVNKAFAVNISDKTQTVEAIVQSGDTLTRIFDRHKLELTDLYEIAQLKQFKSQLAQLRPKQKILISHDKGNVIDLRLQLSAGKELQVYKNDFGFDGEILQNGKPVSISLKQNKKVAQKPAFQSCLALKVKSGDTLYNIFRRHKLNLSDLDRILNLHPQSRHQLQNLQVNQKLVIERTKKNRVKTLSLAMHRKSTLHFTKRGSQFKAEVEKQGKRVALGFKPKKRVAQQSKPLGYQGATTSETHFSKVSLSAPVLLRIVVIP